jgi:hypothetical protein
MNKDFFMNKRMRQIVGEEIDNVMKNDSEGKYASTLQNEELTEGVTYLYAKNTGLPFDIIVDCGRTYEYCGHPLCLYIVNGDNVIPINITKNIKHSSECPIEIAMFIQDNYNALCAFANMEIDGPDFFDIIKDYKYKVDGFNK